MSNPEIMLRRPDEPGKAPNAGGQAGQPAPQNVIVQAKVLIERTGFVGHSFAEVDAEVVSFFKALLGEMSVKCISGEAAEAKSVSEKVKERIKQAELFVGIFTRREKIEGKDQWNTGPWVIEEKTYAESLGKKLILLKETGISHIGGMQGDYEYIEFDRDNLHKSAIRLIQTLWSINPGRLSMSHAGGLGMSGDIMKAAIAAQPHEWTSPRTVDTQLRVYNHPGRSSNGTNAAHLRP
jgi:hypothetical protein